VGGPHLLLDGPVARRPQQRHALDGGEGAVPGGHRRTAALGLGAELREQALVGIVDPLGLAQRVEADAGDLLGQAERPAERFVEHRVAALRVHRDEPVTVDLAVKVEVVRAAAPPRRARSRQRALVGGCLGVGQVVVGQPAARLVEVVVDRPAAREDLLDAQHQAARCRSTKARRSARSIRRARPMRTVGSSPSAISS
jgi:hypothetical protein